MLGNVCLVYFIILVVVFLLFIVIISNDVLWVLVVCKMFGLDVLLK